MWLKLIISMIESLYNIYLLIVLFYIICTLPIFILLLFWKIFEKITKTVFVSIFNN